jgi:hypothetical protein
MPPLMLHMLQISPWIYYSLKRYYLILGYHKLGYHKLGYHKLGFLPAHNARWIMADSPEYQEAQIHDTARFAAEIFTCYQIKTTSLIA